MFELTTWPRNPWSIFDELESLREDMNLALSGREERAASGRGGRGGQSYPLMNVWASDEGLVIDAELPGVNPGEVDVSVVGDELTLQGKVNVGAEREGATYYRRERPAGEFVRTLQLPFRAHSEKVMAAYKNGVLRITIPKSEEEKPKKIKIEA